MTIRVLVADDEALARDELLYLLKQEHDIDIVGEAANGEDALSKILQTEPDVIFLDIQMPKLDGLTLARKLIEMGFETRIVFATAYDQHAIQAFEVNAVDYLLKPFEAERVKIAIERIRQVKSTGTDDILKLLNQLSKEKTSTQVPAPTIKLTKLVIQNEESLIFLDPNEILYIFREGREVHIQTEKRRYSTKQTLQALEEKLTAYPFVRTHRGYLVNLNYAESLAPWFNGAYTLILKDPKKSQIPVSRAYLKNLKDILNI